MFQLIAVTLIVGLAFGIAGYKIYLRFFGKQKINDPCSGCNGCSLKNQYKTRQQACSEDPDLRKKYQNKGKDDK